jgi:hypothetical protein
MCACTGETGSRPASPEGGPGGGYMWWLCSHPWQRAERRTAPPTAPQRQARHRQLLLGRVVPRVHLGGGAPRCHGLMHWEIVAEILQDAGRYRDWVEQHFTFARKAEEPAT